MFCLNLRYPLGVIVKITRKNIHLRCDIPFTTKFISLCCENICVNEFHVGDSVEISYHYDDEFSLVLDKIQKASLDNCSRCFSFKEKTTNCLRCQDIRDIDAKLRVKESMRLVAIDLKLGYDLKFVDESGYILHAERIYPINPLFRDIKNLVLNKSYEVVAWQKYTSSWFIEVIDIKDREYIF